MARSNPNIIATDDSLVSWSRWICFAQAPVRQSIA